jgi:hypothetical protein
MTNLGLFYDCSPLDPILWLSSPVSNAHCLQIFFSWVQPPGSRSAYSSSSLWKCPTSVYDHTFRFPLVSPGFCYVILDVSIRLQSLKASRHLRLLWIWIVNPTPNPQPGGPGYRIFLDHHLWPVRYGRSYQWLHYRRFSPEDHITTRAPPQRQSRESFYKHES